MKALFSVLLVLIMNPVFAQLLTKYEQSEYTASATYEEVMAFYRELENRYEEVTIHQHGLTDIGVPLHVVLIHRGEERSPQALHDAGKSIWLINNAIHPGETDGVSASQMFARDILEGRKYRQVLEKVAIAIIPMYNIGGALNRNSTTRVNQNGPEEYGFRGNARHYDLNRDFIKSDTKNSRSFQILFQQYDPDLILDTHVSNGADYQHIMMLLSTQKDKFGGALGNYIDEVFEPFCYKGMRDRGFDPTPYVNAWGSTPDKGWSQFMDWPRYSTGYAALFHTIGYMSETHMLKTYQQRVEATYALMETMLEFLDEKGKELIDLRKQKKESIATMREFEISWVVDASRFTPFQFKGYEPVYVPSEISGLQRLKYDHDQPFSKEIRYQNHYQTDKVITAPRYYVIPQQWDRVIDLLTINQIEMTRLNADTTMMVEVYTIENYETVRNPYEGHYRHYNTEVSSSKVAIDFRQGDVLVPVDQWRNRYIVETLEPEAPDSFFNWNFFDPILQQKEHFSFYVFEDLALKILEEQPVIKTALETAKRENQRLAESAYLQLEFIYQRSQYREPEYMRYPIFRVME
jgi:hypothetical protein